MLGKIGETFGEMEIGDDVYDMRDYMVPYMWGTLGLLYNTRIISEEELEKYGWGMLWNESDNPELENMILMKDSVRDSYAAVVFYMEEYGLLPDGVSETYGKPYAEPHRQRAHQLHGQSPPRRRQKNCSPNSANASPAMRWTSARTT